MDAWIQKWMPSSTGVGHPLRRSSPVVDDRVLRVALVSSAILLWIPFSLAAVYMAYCRAFFVGEEGGTTSAVINSIPASISKVPMPFWATMGLPAEAAFMNHFRLPHRYHQWYYRIFPEGFDIAAFLPEFVRAVVFSSFAVGSTYFFAVHMERGGDYLMAVAWLLGVLSEFGWLASPINPPSLAPRQAPSNDPRLDQANVVYVDGGHATPPRWLWLVGSIFTGLFSGILCKVKDVLEGRHDRYTRLFLVRTNHCQTEVPAHLLRTGVPHRVEDSHSQIVSETLPTTFTPSKALAPPLPSGYATEERSSGGPVSLANVIGLGERLYVVVPFCAGQWLCFILQYGWRGIIVENGIIVLSLGMVGYTMLSYKLLKCQLRASRKRRFLPHVRSSVRQASGGDHGTADEAEDPGLDAYKTVEMVCDDDENDVGFDLVELISKLFTTSFGVVVVAVLGLNVLVTWLAIPFLKALFSLNALVSSVGIIVELIFYDVL